MANVKLPSLNGFSVVNVVGADGSRTEVRIPSRTSTQAGIDQDRLEEVLASCGPGWITKVDLTKLISDRLHGDRFSISSYRDWLVGRLVAKRRLIEIKRPDSQGRKANNPSRAYRHSKFTAVRVESPWPA